MTTSERAVPKRTKGFQISIVAKVVQRIPRGLQSRQRAVAFGRGAPESCRLAHEAAEAPSSRHVCADPASRLAMKPIWIHLSVDIAVVRLGEF
ncbi:hypothetical protein D6T64_00990 [Cryobacterium melibiosiphilum]|uniref:Uncharacterized protein n=1 Tax=Cryobacterium melibiosiphilum TaxID=995039 RepID=A0A3A5N3P4_9MICO|nr:hypothetical protein D6T64_00990 [Cryobacterium melibiosiphilum]